MDFKLKNIFMMLLPTTILSLSYFWWRQKKLKTKTGDEDEINQNEIFNPKAADLSLTQNKKPDTVKKDVVEEEVCIVKEQPEEHSSPDTFDESLSLNEYQHAPKRKREHSNCDGDSAYVEDFISDTVSITGSDTNSNKTPSTPEEPICEELIVPEMPASEESIAPEIPEKPICEELIAPDVSEDVESAPSNNFRDWFGPAHDNPVDRSDTFVDSIHWGSQPASDLENDTEEINPIKHEVIGGVGIEKLSIVLEKEYNERKAQNLNSKKSVKSGGSPRKSPRSPKKSPKSPTKKTDQRFQSPKSPKSPKTKKTPRHKERDLDKPWREAEKSEVTECETEALPLYPNDYVVLEYTIPEDICGKIIGKHGKAVKDINDKTGAYVCIETEKVGCKCLLSISGLYYQVQEAEKILTSKHQNSIVRYTSQGLDKTQISNSMLPCGEYIDVIVTAVINAGNLFVQMFNPEVDEKLVTLQADLDKYYNQPPQRLMFHESKIPSVGEVCVGFVDNMWCRVKVLDYTSDSDVIVMFLDYGGSVITQWHLLYKISKEFLELPTQAVQCYLVDSYPLPNHSDYSYSANLTLNQMVEGKALRGYVHTTCNDAPCIELFYFNEDTNEEVSVNGNLLSWGLVSAFDPNAISGSSQIIEVESIENKNVQTQKEVESIDKE